MLIEIENSKFKATVDLISIDSTDIDYRVDEIEYKGDSSNRDLVCRKEEITEVLTAELERREMI